MAGFEQIAENPRFEKQFEQWSAQQRKAFKKVDLLIDENIGDLGEALKGVKDFRLHAEPAGRSDEYLWRKARREGWLLVTKDVGFWDDEKYPLHLSPGLVVLRGRTFDQYLVSLRAVFVRLGTTKPSREVGSRFPGGRKGEGLGVIP